MVEGRRVAAGGSDLAAVPDTHAVSRSDLPDVPSAGGLPRQGPCAPGSASVIWHPGPERTPRPWWRVRELVALRILEAKLDGATYAAASETHGVQTNTAIQ